MVLDLILDSIAAACVIGAAALSVAAGIGLLRFPDVLSRLHAATKPQIFGLLLIIAAIAIEQRSVTTLLALLPVFAFQSITAPVAAHMVGRASYRLGQAHETSLVFDELSDDIAEAEQDETRAPTATGGTSWPGTPDTPRAGT